VSDCDPPSAAAVARVLVGVEQEGGFSVEDRDIARAAWEKWQAANPSLADEVRSVMEMILGGI